MAWQDKGAIDLSRFRQQPQQPSKGFWTDQISTGGGIGGALGGAALGAAAGSVVPVVGTTIGGLLGAILGGAAGSGAGEFAENKITNEADPWKNVGQEALLGGVFSAPPIRGAKALYSAGKALTTGAGKAAAKTAAERALTQPGMIAKAIGKGGQSLSGVTDDFAVKQFRFSPSQTSNFKKKFGEDAGKVINRYGFGSADDIATKGVNPLQEKFALLTENVGKVSKDDVAKSFNSKIATLRKSAVADNKSLAKQLEQQRDLVLSKFGNEGLDGPALNAVKREFDSLVNYTQQAANPARYGVNKRSADAIRETLQKADPTGTLKDVGQEISKLKQLQDIALKQSELGRGSLPANLTGLLGAGVGGGIAGNPVAAAAGFAATKAINSQAGRRALNTGTEAIGEKLTSAGAKQFDPLGAKRLIGGQIGADLASSAVDMAQGDTQPTLDSVLGQSSLGMSNPMYTSNAQATNVPSAANMGPSYNTQPQPSSPYSSQRIGNALMQALTVGDQPAIEQLSQMYELAQMMEESQQPASQKLNATQIQQSNNAQSALADLSKIRQTITDDPGVIMKEAIPGGGIARGLTGTTGYSTAKENIVDVIARLRSGAAITEDEAARYMSMLPTLGDSQDSAIQKLDRLQSLLEGFAYPQAAAGSLQDALTQGAY